MNSHLATTFQCFIEKLIIKFAFLRPSHIYFVWCELLDSMYEFSLSYNSDVVLKSWDLIDLFF
jgi:hypothetical protein